VPRFRCLSDGWTVSSPNANIRDTRNFAFWWFCEFSWRIRWSPEPSHWAVSFSRRLLSRLWPTSHCCHRNLRRLYWSQKTVWKFSLYHPRWTFSKRPLPLQPRQRKKRFKQSESTWIRNDTFGWDFEFW
jgi:hypothetical protein